MSEITYTIKSFDEYGEIVNTFSSYDEAIDNFDDHVNKGDPTYLYKGSEMINSFDPIYDEYCNRVAFGTTCVYCGGHSGDGYCDRSPDGNHVLND